MSRVSGCDPGLVDVVGDGVIKNFERLPDLQRSWWCVRRQYWSEQPVMNLGVEDREALAVVGEAVGVGMGQPDDQPFSRRRS